MGNYYLVSTEELYHHGVKGMKWGVRRAKRKEAREARRTKNWSADAREAHALKKKSMDQLTNEELRKRNQRSQLEAEYKRHNPNAVKKGLAIATAVVGTGLTVATLYKKGKATAKIGREMCDDITEVAGNMVMRDLARGMKDFTID